MRPFTAGLAAAILLTGCGNAIVGQQPPAATSTGLDPTTRAPAAVPVSGCDLIASPEGSDGAPGAARSPLATAQALVDRLSPGQTGCLRAGSYSADDLVRLGTSGITLTSYPGERATVHGRVWISDDAPDSSVINLDLDGRNDGGLPSPTINGDRAVLAGNDITNHHTGICVSIGSAETFGRAQGTLVEGNTIHDCGRLPATNFDHGIYVNSADDTVIRGNWIYDNADRGVQLYPDAQRSLVTGNVIDGNGEGVIFGGGEDTASSDNVVEHNVITNSRVRSDIESSWGGPVGTGNVARDNCVGGPGPNDAGVDEANGGFSVSGNVESTGTAESCALLTP